VTKSYKNHKLVESFPMQLACGNSVYMIEIGSKSFFGEGKITIQHDDIAAFDDWFKCNISRSKQAKLRAASAAGGIPITPVSWLLAV
jgi:hypothetical protein